MLPLDTSVVVIVVIAVIALADVDWMANVATHPVSGVSTLVSGTGPLLSLLLGCALLAIAVHRAVCPRNTMPVPVPKVALGNRNLTV